MKPFRLGDNFPNEGFVQRAVGQHFSALGFAVEPLGYVDFACRHPETGQRWIVEAKGQTSEVGLDFRTGLGQLVQAMQDESICYGLAVPDTPQFLAQYKRVAPWVRKALRMRWLVTQADGAIRTIEPEDERS